MAVKVAENLVHNKPLKVVLEYFTCMWGLICATTTCRAVFAKRRQFASPNGDKPDSLAERKCEKVEIQRATMRHHVSPFTSSPFCIVTPEVKLSCHV